MGAEGGVGGQVAVVEENGGLGVGDRIEACAHRAEDVAGEALRVAERAAIARGSAGEAPEGAGDLAADETRDEASPANLLPVAVDGGEERGGARQEPSLPSGLRIRARLGNEDGVVGLPDGVEAEVRVGYIPL